MALKNVNKAKSRIHRDSPGGTVGGGECGKTFDWARVVIVSVLVTVVPVTPEGTTDGGPQKHTVPMGIPGYAGGQLRSTGSLNPFKEFTETV